MVAAFLSDTLLCQAHKAEATRAQHGSSPTGGMPVSALRPLSPRRDAARVASASSLPDPLSVLLGQPPAHPRPTSCYPATAPPSPSRATSTVMLPSINNSGITDALASEREIALSVPRGLSAPLWSSSGSVSGSSAVRVWVHTAAPSAPLTRCPRSGDEDGSRRIVASGSTCSLSGSSSIREPSNGTASAKYLPRRPLVLMEPRSAQVIGRLLAASRAPPPNFALAGAPAPALSARAPNDGRSNSAAATATAASVPIHAPPHESACDGADPVSDFASRTALPQASEPVIADGVKLAAQKAQHTDECRQASLRNELCAASSNLSETAEVWPDLNSSATATAAHRPDDHAAAEDSAASGSGASTISDEQPPPTAASPPPPITHRSAPIPVPPSALHSLPGRRVTAPVTALRHGASLADAVSEQDKDAYDHGTPADGAPAVGGWQHTEQGEEMTPASPASPFRLPGSSLPPVLPPEGGHSPDSHFSSSLLETRPHFKASSSAAHEPSHHPRESTARTIAGSSRCRHLARVSPVPFSPEPSQPSAMQQLRASRPHPRGNPVHTSKPSHSTSPASCSTVSRAQAPRGTAGRVRAYIEQLQPYVGPAPSLETPLLAPSETSKQSISALSRKREKTTNLQTLASLSNDELFHLPQR